MSSHCSSRETCNRLLNSHRVSMSKVSVINAGSDSHHIRPCLNWNSLLLYKVRLEPAQTLFLLDPNTIMLHHPDELSTALCPCGPQSCLKISISSTMTYGKVQERLFHTCLIRVLAAESQWTSLNTFYWHRQVCRRTPNSPTVVVASISLTHKLTYS